MPLAVPQHREIQADADAPLLPPGVGSSFILVSIIFTLWGIPNNLNDVLIRQFMKSFELTRFQAGLVQFAFYLGYFLLALPAGILMRHKGYKAGFVTGLLLFAVGCFSFPFAASSGQYGAFLAALFVIASGLAFLETAASPFVAQLGPTATSERRLNIAAAFNSIGSIIGVVVGNLFIFSGIELSAEQRASMQSSGSYMAYLHHEIMRTVAPYLVLGGIVLLWAFLVARQRFPAFISNREHNAEAHGDWRALLHEPHLLFAIVAQFFYVGSQVGTWSYLIPYARDYVQTSDRASGWLLTGTLLAFAAGRIASSWMMGRIQPSRLMALFCVINMALSAIGVLLPGWPGVVTLLFSSFFMSLMFPTIFGLGLRDLGANTNIAGSFLVMTIVGGALMPMGMGLLADRTHSTAFGYTLPFLGYAVILAFSLYMTRYNRERMVRSTFEV